jgi:hypothetical protein
MKSALTQCEIGGHPTKSYSELVKAWKCYYDGSACPLGTKSYIPETCSKNPKCQRSIYQMNLQPLKDVLPGINNSLLKIQLASPHVQYIEDSHSYDFQSFIGEVGGTLGLFLGLSFLSIVNCIEFAVTKFFPANT